MSESELQASGAVKEDQATISREAAPAAQTRGILDTAALTAQFEAIADPAKQAEVVVQVRFKPDGKVNTINERPSHIEAQDWFDILCRVAGRNYQALAGGRGAFRLSFAQLAILREAVEY